MISEEEGVLLCDYNKSLNLDLLYDQYSPFKLDYMKNDECLAEFRARKRDIPLLEEALQIPEEFTLKQRSVLGGTEGLCTLLKRLTCPCRYSNMLPRFDCPVPVLCIMKDAGRMQLLAKSYCIHEQVSIPPLSGNISFSTRKSFFLIHSGSIRRSEWKPITISSFLGFWRQWSFRCFDILLCVPGAPV